MSTRTSIYGIPGSVRRPTTAATPRRPAVLNLKIYSLEDITNAMGAVISIPITAQTLEKPTQDAVRVIYGDVYDWFSGGPLTTANAILEHEGHERQLQPDTPANVKEATTYFGMLGRYAHMMKTCGVDDFNVMDLLKPDGTRLRRHLSAVITYGNFRAWRHGDVEEAANQIRQKAAELTRKEQEIENTVREIEATEANIRENTERGQELRAQNSEIEAKLHHFKAQRVEALRHQETYKKNKEQLAKRLEEYTLLFEGLDRHNQTLRPYANESVATRRQIVSELEDTVKERKTRLDALDLRQQRLLQALEYIRMSHSELEQCSVTLQGCERDLAIYKEASAQHSSIQSQASARQQDLEAVKLKVQQLEKQISEYEEREQRILQSEADERRKSSEQAREVSSRRDMIKSEEEAALKQRREKEATLRQLEQKTKQALVDHETETNAMRARHKELDAQLNAYMHSLGYRLDGDAS